jgi:hypothetical protein
MKHRRTEASKAEPVEEHDSGFVGPMVLFGTFPHNDTFDESRQIDIIAQPVDSRAEIYTFTHNKHDYGIMRTEDLRISATVKIHTSNNGNAPAADRQVALYPAPLKLGWKSKEVFINNQLINPQSNKENELCWVNQLLTEVPSGYKYDDDITLMIHDTPGYFDSIAHIHNNGGANLVNLGARRRYLLCKQDDALICSDHLDLIGYNKRYVPTSFDFKVRLTRLEKMKVLMGDAGHCGAVDVRFTDLKLTVPITKPNAQLSQAINELMIQKGDECRFYVTSYRYVAIPIAQGARRILHNDIFNGSRPTRLITKIIGQDHYNGAHTLNPNLIEFPDIDYFVVKINDAIIPPILHNSQEAYINLRRVLDRRYSEMPFTHTDYASSYGIIVHELCTNLDSYDQVLPNSTAGNISLDINFKQDTAAAQQLICIGEFRNQLSIGYGTQARLKYDV